MNREQFEQMVDGVLETLPQWVLDTVDNLHIVVEDWPSHDQDPDGEGLLGLYEGVSLHDRGNEYFASLPDVITIFRLPHMRLGLDDATLATEVRKTVLHEVAHHLGIDDDRLHELGWD